MRSGAHGAAAVGLKDGRRHSVATAGLSGGGGGWCLAPDTQERCVMQRAHAVRTNGLRRCTRSDADGAAAVCL